MIHRNYEEPADGVWFRKWKAKADAETAVAVAEYAAARKEGRPPEYEFKSAIWSEFKEHLLHLFNNKCAYCEALFLHVAFGDVEHYRPKKRVTEAPGHPGYYWLAYDPRNLLPSCVRCNRGDAKMNQFPVADPAKRAASHHGSLAGEAPLLLNPYEHNPQEHLAFQAESGMVEVKAGSKLGEASIVCYRLNREDLTSARSKAQHDALAGLYVDIVREDNARLGNKVAAYLAGTEEFSRAVLSQIAARFAKVIEILTAAVDPPPPPGP
jgi:hypothetical protein